MKKQLTYEKIYIENRLDIKVTDLGDLSLRDTLECGQAFRYEKIKDEYGYIEYMTVVGESLISVGQFVPGELIFYNTSEEEFLEKIVPYFALDLDYGKIREYILSRTDSEWLKRAADCAAGIHILKQDSWEALFSFIISQNNNIPRIRKIIKKLSAEYGENLAIKKQLSLCPTGLCKGAPDESVCRECGICYSFPTAEAVIAAPEKMNSAKVGFRYKYLLDSARRVESGETDLKSIENAETFDLVCQELKKILGVGDKVASCVALFGMARLEAFPIDVWMKRAIDLYFNGKLHPKTLGEYAGVAQQYIFHYIRNLEEK